MTLIERIRNGEIPEIIKTIAKNEQIAPEIIAQRIDKGTIVIPANINRPPSSPKGVGEGLSVKINANFGTSQDHGDTNEEIEKLKIAVKYGADAVMDLSTGPKMIKTLNAVLDNSPVMVGTVPIYEAFLMKGKLRGSIGGVTVDDFFNTIEEHGKRGVDFVTLHCGLTQGAFDHMKKQGRLINIVSRGGALLVAWMQENKKENPLYEHYDRVLEICKKYDMTISLGDGMRPGAIEDATDRAQIQELLILGELVKRANEAGVQAMVEGPGHVPIDEIETNIKIQKTLCHGAPFYVLGPLVTDIAPGYDHIVGAIGGAIAARAGVDFLCYVTPAEHLRLPTVADVKDGVIASKIAAHAADISRKVPGAKERDYRMSQHRKDINWEGMYEECLDPEKARKMREELVSQEEEACSMCGEFCAVKTINKVMREM